MRDYYLMIICFDKLFLLSVSICMQNTTEGKNRSFTKRWFQHNILNHNLKLALCNPPPVSTTKWHVINKAIVLVYGSHGFSIRLNKCTLYFKHKQTKAQLFKASLA